MCPGEVGLGVGWCCAAMRMRYPRPVLRSGAGIGHAAFGRVEPASPVLFMARVNVCSSRLLCVMRERVCFRVEAEDGWSQSNVRRNMRGSKCQGRSGSSWMFEKSGWSGLSKMFQSPSTASEGTWRETERRERVQSRPTFLVAKVSASSADERRERSRGSTLRVEGRMAWETMRSSGELDGSMLTKYSMAAKASEEEV